MEAPSSRYRSYDGSDARLPHRIGQAHGPANVAGINRTGSHAFTDFGTEADTDYHARRPQRQGAAAIRGESARQGAERAHHPDRRHGLRPIQCVRRADPHADLREAGKERTALQQVSHDRAVLADSRRAADRPQSPRLQHGLDHRNGDRVSRSDRAATQRRRAAGRDAAAQRLQHRRLRQVARDGRVGSQPVRPDRSLADALRVRQVLRLHRRRNEPVGTGDLRRHEPHRGAERSELSLHDRHDQPGNQVDECAEIADAGQAVLHLLRTRRDARAAPLSEGVDREVQGQVRPGLGQAPRGDARPPDQARRRSRRHQARPQARSDQGLGQAQRRREEALRPPDGSLRRLRRVRRRRDRPAHPGHRRPRPAGQHAHLLRSRRQRRESRRHHERRCSTR